MKTQVDMTPKPLLACACGLLQSTRPLPECAPCPRCGRMLHLEADLDHVCGDPVPSVEALYAKLDPRARVQAIEQAGKKAFTVFEAEVVVPFAELSERYQRLFRVFHRLFVEG